MLKRWFFFILGLFFIALGISCAVKGGLGAATISSLPYIVSLRYSVSLGEITFIVNVAFLLGQLLILRSDFKITQWLQIFTAGFLGFFIDFTMYLLTNVTPEMYISKLMMVVTGVVVMGLGIALELIGNIIMVPGEGLVKVIAIQWHLDFGTVKTWFDIILVLSAGLLSWFYFGEINGIREGTLFYAFFTGIIAQFFIKQFRYRFCLKSN